MNKIGMAMEELHRSENHLTRDLLQLSDRHKADHEIYYVARDLARWSTEHVGELARAARDFGLDLDAEPDDEPGTLAGLQQKAAELVGRRPEPGMLLLTDLRHLYRDASGVSLDWEVLGRQPPFGIMAGAQGRGVVGSGLVGRGLGVGVAILTSANSV